MVLGVDAGLVQSLVGLRARGLQVSIVHVVGASFAAPASPEDAEAGGLRAALAAAGVRCLTLHRGDDLRAALSFGPAEARWAEPARALRR